VFDITGREVRSLASGSFDAGAHEIQWDGTDATGAKVASGLYYYRLTSGERTEQRAMMVQR
jgi:flagellar hook assembly protein FlgD